MAVTAGAAQAASSSMAGAFCMYDPNGNPVADFSWGGNQCDIWATGSIDVVAGTASLSSTKTFFGFPWTAHDLTLMQAGSYSINTGNGIQNFTVGAGQLGVHMLFDWNGNLNIDVVNVWNVSLLSGGNIVLTSSDIDGDGIPGMPTTEAFPGFSANFDMVTEPVVVCLAVGVCPPPPPVPVPAAVWLFGSGLLGLISWVRCK